MPHIIFLDQEVSYYLGSGMHRVSNKNLACGDGPNLDCDEVMVTTSDFGTTIITIGGHYSVLSC
jgi:hypothetical protein